MKTILVPTDFSKNANNALDYAIAIAKKEKAKIILLHAYNVIYIYPDVPVQYAADQMRATEYGAKKQLDALCAKVEVGGKLKCDYFNRQGLAVDIILEASQKMKPDLIVMGTKGASGVQEVLIGSNTAKVMEKAKCPVIAVPNKVAYSPIKNITYATNYETSDIEALRKLVDIAKLFDARITLLHIYYDGFAPDLQEEHMLKFKNKISSKIRYKKMVFKFVYGKNLMKVLEDHVKQESPDLLSMSTHHRNLFDKLFGSSLTKKMSYHSKVPLMAFHSKKARAVAS
jgi:nucleotide-binding universal stress UspA family protein